MNGVSAQIRCLCDENGPHTRKALLLILVFWAVQFFLVCRTTGDFWFEDDAPHRVFVRDHSNPLAYFGPTLVSELSLGHSVTPWFPLTFWVDHQLGSLDPFWAYLHTGISLLLTAWVLYALLARFMRWRIALAATALWLFLPSTIVITEFLSTRHYLEGLLISLASFTFCLWGQDAAGRKRLFWSVAAALTYLLACTTKEIYVSATWLALLGFYAYWRRPLAALGVFGCGLLYAAYRFWSLGLVGKDLGQNFASRYHLFIARWPYMFSGNEGGYLLVGLGLIAGLFLLWKRRLSWFETLFIAGLGGSMLLTIFPVSANVTDQYQELGTWYRVVFLLNTFMLGLAAFLVDRLNQHKASLLALCLCTLVVLPGGFEASQRWDTLKGTYRRDADFYRQCPDLLLYSRLPAPWFLYGIHQLYFPGQEPHYLTWRVDRGTPEDYVRRQLAVWSEIWVFSGTDYRADSGLLPIIAVNCDSETTPLDKDWADASPLLATK